MEYTKDVVLSINYSEDKKRWTSRLANVIKSHKIMTATVFSGIVFISVDVVLVSNFFRILTMI